jgi:hypothetical protein
LKGFKGASCGCCAADQHIVEACQAQCWKSETRDFTQSAPGPVSDNSVPDFLGAGKADAQRVGIVAVSGLQNETGNCLRLRFGSGQEIPPVPQMQHRFRRSSAEALATTGAATSDDVTATDGGHARAEAMAALADKLGRLIGALHDETP